ncbi:type I restriction modification DNA specificity domain protein [Lautropia mirabilis ATCC 51599]|uniref:Type I restriction modification DNA specificity domain protein n=2 Tax=Lautropia mirabilis TaxID=47671 RepID=E7RZK7_9BURK|nr:type I restriction modification DNA specificity domain protein [Lautropia mirabilis ATCC 51599]
MGFDDFFLSGIPVLSAKHVKTDGLVDVQSMRYASTEMYKKWMTVEVQEGDIILTSEAPMGEVFYIQDDKKYVLGQRVFGLRPNPRLINPKYLAAWLASSEGQRQITARASGSTVQGIRQVELLKLEVDLPSKEEQERIANVRFSLTDKIILNRCINQTLEAMVQAIFKSWFVDFDPVKAKIAAIEQGQDPLRAAMRAISGKTDAELDQMPREHHDELAATAELFPDAMEESKLGNIPNGWEVKRVGDLIELAYGKALKSTDRKQGSVPVYGSGGVTGYHNEALVPHGAIIVGRKGTVGSLYWEDGPFFPIDTTFYVKPKVLPMTYCFYAMQTLGLDKMNTDAAVPGLNRENVYRLELVKPSISVLSAFDGLIGQTRKAMRANTIASRSLAELRDSLLPKLLSGELAIDKIPGLVDTTGAI